MHGTTYDHPYELTEAERLGSQSLAQGQGPGLDQASSRLVFLIPTVKCFQILV